MKPKINYTLILIVAILVIIFVSIGNRIATSLFFLKGFHLVDTNYVVTPPSQTVNGITFIIGYIPEGSPYHNSLLNAEFNAFLVTIKNNGSGYLDFDPMNFFLERGPKQVERALSPDEAKDAVSNGFLGSTKPIRIARKLIGMTYIPSARLFPGYERTGILLFPRFVNSPKTFAVKFAHMALNTQPFPDVLFTLQRSKSPSGKPSPKQ
ncbi:MAG: DUF4352 domain-containing protein [Nitrospirae bacterium]|nr:DUF4352 domain-containing protein [Nitrospirota bacterium]MCL5286219.1 DUF4352 domain-containing protein [Nitrospirota bacterium]